MNSDLISGLDYFEREKGIRREVLVEAVQNALLSASKKAIGPARELRIEIDGRTGEIRALANLLVVENVQNSHDEIALTKARTLKPNVALGESIEVEVTPRNFGRIAAQTAKQAMMQRIRQAEKEMVYDEFKDRAGEIVSGTVRRFERSDVIIDLGKFEAVMPSRERVQTEDYNVGDRIRAYVVAVEVGPAAPRSSFPAATPISSAASLRRKSAKSPTKPSKSGASPAKPGTAPRSPSTAPTTKWIPWEPALA